MVQYFIGPTLLSGIGQHCNKYVRLFPDAKYIELKDVATALPHCETAFAFLIPVGDIRTLCRFIKERAKRVICMTVCETETVHEHYGIICEEFPKLVAPSEFCKRVLERQFPGTEVRVIHAHIPEPEDVYTYYVIGNILDQRKNFRAILEAFVRLNEPNTRLLVKATCVQDVSLNLPRVKIVNGLVSEEELENIHRQGDCYVSFSSSEGVGMGACEAALRNKPVIITDYGGAPEYVKTPYLISCGRATLERDDFLFKRGMEWGAPDATQLLAYMRDAFEKRLRWMDHAHTRQLVSRENIVEEFSKAYCN